MSAVMPFPQQANCNQIELEHRRHMAILAIFGVAILMVVASLCWGLVKVIDYCLQSEKNDIAIAVGIYSGLTGLLTTLAAYIAPSPLQNSSRRNTDQNNTPKEIGEGVVEAAREANGLEVQAADGVPVSPTDPKPRYHDEDDDEEVEVLDPSFLDEDGDDEDFGVTDPVERGAEEIIDPRFFEDDDNDGIINGEDADWNPEEGDTRNGN